jgi:cytoskeleton protein RodZ
LAASIKVSQRKLEALENNRWDELPDATFARALALTVCRTLKMDAKPVLELLPASNVSKLENVAGSLNTPFSERGSPGAGLAGGGLRPLVWGGLALLLAALIVYFMPAPWWERFAGGQVDGNAGAESVQLPALAGAASEALLTASPLVADPLSYASAASVVAASAASPAAATGVVSAPTLAASRGGMVSGHGIQLVINQSSWIEARDTTGRLIVSRLVETGEQLAIEGEPPISLVIGNAAGVELRFKQKRVDLQTLTSNNVARLQLPP